MSRTLLALLFGAACLQPCAALSLEQRRSHLDWMFQNLPEVAPWTEWQKQTGELPPDFDALPVRNFLPDPLRFSDGRPVSVAAEWPARRAEILAAFEQYQTGRFPPKPDLVRAVLLDETPGRGCVTRNLRLEFGPGGRGSVRVRITTPEGAGPRPALICPYLAGWTERLVRRGYVSVGYAGNDFLDDAAALKDLYPKYDFASLPRRAWLAQVVIDHLLTLPEVDPARIAIFGYSRDGKMAVTAAVLDTRIAAVIAGSTGVGGVLPWRLAGERGMGESIESTTRMFPDWFHPRLRFFAGQEQRLPIEANLVVAALAPRACLMEYGLNDEVSNVWANEQSYHSALTAYQLLGRPERLGLLRVPGFHGSNDPEACLDWLDIQFGRSSRRWENPLLFPWDFGAWRVAHAAEVDLARYPIHVPGDELNPPALVSRPTWESQAERLRATVQSFLGPVPARAAPSAVENPAARLFQPPAQRPGPTETALGRLGNPGQLEPDVPAWVISRGGPEFGWLEPEKNQVISRRIRFGAGLAADLYLPAGTREDARLPAMIWLHGWSHPLGYMWVYRRDLHPILALVKAGYAVLAYDQCGFGSRMGEAGPFYDRYPGQSLLGRMVEDVRAAVDRLQDERQIDGARVGVVGYSVGGTVALHAAALDPRIQSVVAISAFTPMRTDTADRPTGGLARLSVEYPLLPRLGLFIGNEPRLPYDYDGLLALIAPRPLLVVQPARDRDAAPAEVRETTDRVRRVYSLFDSAGNLELLEPDDYQRLSTPTQNAVLSWMANHVSPTAKP